MFTPELLLKLFSFGLLWSQSYQFTNVLMKLIPNNDISRALSYTLVFVLIHMIDIYYENHIKNKQS